MADKLTKRYIDTLKYEGKDGKKDVRWDTTISGFGIRVYPSGKKSFILSYRQNGTKRLYTIGQYGKITLEQARNLAIKRLGEVADGKDPVTERQKQKKKHEWTVQKAFSSFLTKYAKQHTKNWQEPKRIFEKDVLPHIGHKPVDEIKKDDIIKILDKISDRGAGIMANRTLAHMRKFFNWCVQRDLIEHPPTYMVAAPAKKKSRDRVLNDFEIKNIWKACEAFGYPFGDLVKILILTGQRRGEVASMRWKDYDKDEKLWVQPRELTKSNREHYVPLPDMAIDVLEGVFNLGSHIFTSSGIRPFENFSRDKKILDGKLKKIYKEKNLPAMPHWTIHDIRRTVASGMARLKVAPHIIEKILNHSTGQISGVAAVYNRYEYADEMREALDLWAEHIEDLLEEEISAKEK